MAKGKILALWDIDGTLVSLPKQPSKRHIRAVEKYSNRELITLIPLSGETDCGIIYKILKSNNLDTSRLAISNCLKILETISLREITKEEYQLNPNIIQALEFLISKGVTNGILSGNTQNRAHQKLKIVGIDHYFGTVYKFYGENFFTRDSLTAYAEGYISQESKFERIIIIGDTPLDIYCAKTHGFEIIAVATGEFEKNDLKKDNPNLALKNLYQEFDLFKKYI